MQNTVVVHVQSFAVFARPIAVAVVDISITTQERNKLEQEISREEVMKYLTNVRYSWGISRILNQNSVNSEFVKGRPKTSRSSFFMLYIWFVFLLKRFNHPLISCLKF